MNFSIILASRNRPQLLSNLLNSIQRTTTELDLVEVLVGIDHDDAGYKDLSVALRSRYPFVKFFPRDRSPWLNKDYLNWLSKDYSCGKYLIICNDDTEFKTFNWDQIVLRKLNEYLVDKPDGIVYGYLNDALNMSYCCFPLISREAHDAIGYSMPPEYPSWNADIFLWEVYNKAGRVCNISEVLVDHISYHTGKRGKDDINHYVRHLNDRGGWNRPSVEDATHRLLTAIQNSKSKVRNPMIRNIRRMSVINPKISIVLPAIRVDRWQNFINSVDCQAEWEVVIVSPYELPPSLVGCDRITHVVDKGSPMRCSCIGAELAKGKYITWAADDGVFMGNRVLDKAMRILDGSGNNKKVVVTKYLEACAEVHPDSYYVLNNAYPRSPHIPDSWWIFNCAVMHNSYYKYLGGWDCQFEACPLGHADLAARAQRDGAEVELIQDAMLNCTHMPGASGDHGPIYAAHTFHDEPRYAEIYRSPDCVNRVKIDPKNWQNSPAVWLRRFQG